MLKSLLVGLDDSEYAAAAVDLGIELAKQNDALLAGVAVLCEPLFRDSTPPEKLSPSYKPTYDKLVSEAHQHCQAILEKFAQQASAAQVRHAMLEDIGLANEQLAIEAQRFDMLVLGQETHFNFEATQKPCHTLQKLLHNPPRPIVAVPKQPLPGEGILIAYDGSIAASRSLHALVSCGLTRGRVFVLAIDLDNAVVASHVAERAVEYLAYHGVAAENLPVQSETPASQIILDEALSRGVRMIAMGAYGRAGIAEWLFGSTTKHLLSNIPVAMIADAPSKSQGSGKPRIEARKKAMHPLSGLASTNQVEALLQSAVSLLSLVGSANDAT
jgi:nucleotide-binding universal stress UspA family protein